jgi:ABC-type sugar transport system ATPase subunit
LAPRARFVKGLARGLLKEDAALTVGVRPERLVAPASGAFATKGAVERVERLREVSFAHIRRADDQMMVAEIRGRLTPKAGEAITLGADLRDVLVFDEGGRRVELG